jgi:hypothetical protein
MKEERSFYEYAQRIPTSRMRPKTEKVHLQVETVPTKFLPPPERQTRINRIRIIRIQLMPVRIGQGYLSRLCRRYTTLRR